MSRHEAQTQRRKRANCWMSTRSPIWDSNMLDLLEGQNIPGCLDNEPQWNKFHIWHAVIFPWLCPMPFRASLGNSLFTSISLSSASIDVEILSPDLQLHCEHKVNVMISPRHDESSYDKQWKRFKSSEVVVALHFKCHHGMVWHISSFLRDRWDQGSGMTLTQRSQHDLLVLTIWWSSPSAHAKLSHMTSQRRWLRTDSVPNTWYSKLSC